MGDGISAQRHFKRTNGTWILFCLVLVLFPLLTSCNQLALLAGTLRTFQKHACDDSLLEIVCPSNTSIDILHASYGVSLPSKKAPCPPSSSRNLSSPCHLPPSLEYKATQLVLDSCHTKRSCSMEIKASTFAGEDFCPLMSKYIEVAYKCRPDTFINKIICEEDSLTMHCGKDSKIAIFSILFGRSGHEVPQCPQPKGVKEGRCEASYATESVMRLCHGLSRCLVPASTSFFGRPCPAHFALYMKATYTCVPQIILKPPEVIGRGKSTNDESKDLPNVVSDSDPERVSPDRSKGYTHKDVAPTISPTPSQPVSKEMIINCTVTILAGAKQKEIGLVTEWMKAISFMNKNFEKIVLYAVVGACLGALLCLLAVSIHLLRERRKDRARQFVIPEQFSSIETDGERLGDGELDSAEPLGPGSSSSNYSASPPPTRDQDVVSYYAASRPRPRYNDMDLILPRSLSKENNHYLYN